MKQLTINLLPSEKKMVLKRQKRFRVIVQQEVYLSVVFLFFIAILGSISFILSQQLAMLSTIDALTEQQESFRELQKYENTFQQMNTQTAEIARIQKNHVTWQRTFEELSASVPEGVVVQRIRTENNTLFVSGTAVDRAALLRFEEKLKQTDCFTSVSIPLSDLVVRKDVSFSVEFIVKEACVRVATRE